MGDITKEILGQNINEVGAEVQTQSQPQVGAQAQIEQTQQWTPVQKSELPATTGFWNKFKGFWLQEVKIELNPMEQKIVKNVSTFLNKEVTLSGVKNLLFKEIKF